MIRWTRNALIAQGKKEQALQWAKTLTEWANKKYNLRMTVYVDDFGENGNIQWFIDYESPAECEKTAQALLNDQEYLRELNLGADLLIERSAFDTVLHTF